MPKLEDLIKRLDPKKISPLKPRKEKLPVVRKSSLKNFKKISYRPWDYDILERLKIEEKTSE